MSNSAAHWLDRAHEEIRRLEFDHPASWWVVRNISRGICYYAFEPEVWMWELWLGPNGQDGNSNFRTPAGERYGVLTELQLWEWLRRGRYEGTIGVVDMERQRVVLCSCLAYYDYLTRKHQYRVQDGRIKVRMAKRVA